MKKILYIFTGVLLLTGVASANATTFAGGEAYSLGASEAVEGNLYTAGGSVNVSGNVNGDLITAGGNLFIAGKVAEDLIVAGGTINIVGDVGEDVRIVGGNIIISGKMGGELVGAGGQLNILSSSAVRGDLNLSGGAIRLEAPVQGNAEINGGNVYVNGLVAGNLIVRGEKIELGPNASVRGDFTYYSQSEAVISETAAVAGETTFEQIEAPVKKGDGVKGILAVVVWLAIAKTIMVTLLAILFIYIWKRWAKDFVSDATDNFWKRALLGFAVLFLTPIAAVLLMITLVGMIPAGILWLGYCAAILLAFVLAGILTAGLLNRYLFKKPVDSLEWWKVLLGVALFQIVRLIPFIGWLAGLIIFLATIGWLGKITAGVLGGGRK